MSEDVPRLTYRSRFVIPGVAVLAVVWVMLIAFLLQGPPAAVPMTVLVVAFTSVVGAVWWNARLIVGLDGVTVFGVWGTSFHPYEGMTGVAVEAQDRFLYKSDDASRMFHEPVAVYGTYDRRPLAPYSGFIFHNVDNLAAEIDRRRSVWQGART